VAIRFELPQDALERISFAYSPLLEAVLSLHVLLEPKHHALQHRWVLESRALPRDLRRRIGDFAFAYRGLIPEFVTPTADGGYATFDHELEELLGHDELDLALGFLRPLFDHAGRREPGLLDDPGVRRRATERASALGASSQLAALLFEKPRELATRFAELLSDYWQAAFEREWAQLEPRLAATVADAGRRLAAEGLYPFLRTLSPRLRVDEQRQTFGVDLPHDHSVPVTDDRRLVLAPSAFGWPHLGLNCDEPWPLAIVYPAPFLLRSTREAVPPADLSQTLNALADPNRLRALKLIVERPRSTQELAALIGMTDAGMSKHLRTLAAARVLRTRREGYYVLYELDADAVMSISDGLLEFLGIASP
jgi:DNA-binding transcriptional ArsR family regulator